jgi:diguanylate cyclase (GGDEF)-like protein
VLEAMLAHRAFHDPLTGLPNRALFADTLARALGHDPRHPGRVAVLFLDLDGFKLVNDSLGHTAGDQLLGLVAARLRAHVPLEGTVVARFGGDEFAVLLERVADPTTVTHLAERLLEALRAPFALDGHETFVNACVGVAVGVLGEDDSGTLLRHADIALYRAKANGPSSVAVFAPVMEERVLARLQREVALRRAVEGGELRLHYQPVVELASGRMVGAEALVRWAHPELGLLLPVEFIPLAEETGLIVPLGNWVLGEACRQARAWQDATWSAPMGVSVNLSARQLRDPDLVAEVAGMLRENGLDARRLELEVTETVAMADAAVTRHALSALRRLGVRVSIDDFGTGHSSLGRLQELAPDALKIDRSFIAGLSRDRGSEAIVRAVSAMAHDLGLEVTAEGIETAEQAACLRTLGVDRGQGFYLGPPVPSEAVDALLTRPAPMPLSRQSVP